MAQSMLDFGPIIQLAQLSQNAERMDLARQQEARMAQHQDIQQEQFEQTFDLRQREAALHERNAALEQRKLEVDAAKKGFDELDKFSENPALATNRQAQIRLARAKQVMLERITGMKVDLPDDDELMGGYEHTEKLVRAIYKGAPEEQESAFVEAIAANPKWGSNLLDSAKKAGELGPHLADLHNKMEIHKAQLEALNVKNGRMKLQENLFTEHSGAMGRVALLPMDKEFAEHYRKIISFVEEDPQTHTKTVNKQGQDGYLVLHPELKQLTSRLDAEKPAVDSIVAQLEGEIDARWAAQREYEGRGQTPPQEFVDEMAAYQAVYKARRAEQHFIRNPYDPDAYSDLKKAHQDLRIRQSAAGKAIGEIANERTALMSTKYDDKKAATEHLSRAQIALYKLPKDQQTVENAARIIEEKGWTDITPADVIKDPNKAGVSVNLVGEKEQAKEIGGYYGKQFSALDKAGFDAVAKLGKLQRMESLLNQVQTGKLQGAKQKIQEVASALGFEVDPSLPAAQALESATNEMALSLRAPGTGAMSDKDLEVLQTLPPNLSKTPEGNKFILDAYKALAKREQDVARLAREYTKKNNGQFDGGFQDYLADWVEKHPLFEGKKIPGAKEAEGKKAAAAPSTPAEAPASAGPFSDPDKNARYEEWKRRRGK